MTNPLRTLVLIDTASRLATRILQRRPDGCMPLTDDTTAEDIEWFRCGPGIQVFANITQYLSDQQPHF